MKPGTPTESAVRTNSKRYRAVSALLAVTLMAALIVAQPKERAVPRGEPHGLSGAPAGGIAHAEERRRAEVTLRFKQGVAMMQLRQYEHAVTAFHRVLALAPMLPEAHVNMGFAFFELQNHAGAQRFFESAIAIAPQQANAHYGLALTRQAQGDPNGARSEMQRFLALAKNDDPFRPRALARLHEIERAAQDASGARP